MMNLWTNQEISKILIQLDEMKLPFEKYSFARDESALILLGRGGSADVYEALRRDKSQRKYAIKVIGFKNQHADSAFFNESIEAQKDIGEFQDNVVKVYEHTELWVTFDANDNVVSAVKEKPEEISRTCIKLQFVLMEKIASVFERTKAGNIKLTPDILLDGNQDEVLKLAYDIGTALQRAHAKNILHRDVKLENVFYSPKRKQYKLGDFGIAKKTDDGFASTVAFTKGYAAPEVIHTPNNDRYDNTADIYSFGMMLYVLMNDMKFPDSNSYNVNYGAQYERGYIVPEPIHGSKSFYYIIAKMCMYDPDDRYQSMDEVVQDLEKLMYGNAIGYRKEHKSVSLVVGTISLILGIVFWKLTMAPYIVLKFSLWEYVFLVLCFAKIILKVFKKDITLASIGIMGVGIYLIIVSGFSWWKLLIVLWMVFSSGTSSGYLAGGVLLANFLYLIQVQDANWIGRLSEYNWITVLMISVSGFLLFQYEILSMVDRKTVKIIYKKDLYWLVAWLFYICLILYGLEVKGNNINPEIYNRLLVGPLKWLFVESNINFLYVGIYGLAFCTFWLIRERILIWNDKRKLRKYYNV